ncbi:MAG TPA: tannase/feruloyl esterase family alpha/beta hydrolase [Xanthobacteraceae bacterium]|nr:tannase/feruloyl esterase family alpha/beta hydrolase [Xanthobacteraceae bacterium]
MWGRRLFVLASLLAGLCPQLCAAESAAEACARLKQSIPAADIGLPSAGAAIETAELVAPTPLTLAELPFGPLPSFLAVVPAAPEYCKVLGAIAPVDAKASPIRFEVNLPTQWNGASVQFGGGGFNGTLISGLGLPPLAPADRPSPLARGFVTYGTDSGHQIAADVPLQAFALNDEALTNFAYAAYKKVRDAAVVLMQRRYGRVPAKLYYVGLSEGGREGLTMAQRFPGDFDGILSGVPVINWVGLLSSYIPLGVAQFAGGWIAPDKVKLVNDAVIAACDQLDGLADGIISNYEGCKRVFDATKLACAAGGDAACLSPAQLNIVQAMHAPFAFGFTLANGVRSYPGWSFGGEDAAGTGPVGGWVSWQTGSAAPTLPADKTSSRAWLYGSGAVQYFIARDANYDVSKFDPAQFADRLREISALMDSTDPDLSAFAARGGKIIIYENMADYAQSPYAGIDYYESVVARMGAANVDNFLRLYATPGVDHMGVGAPSSVDLLEVLTEWSEQGKAPGELVQVRQQTKPPFAPLAARPMCRYPAYPYYQGGDATKAESFVCKTP